MTKQGCPLHLIIIFLFLLSTSVSAQNTEDIKTDSLKLENIYFLTFSNPEKAEKLISIVEGKGTNKQYLIDDMRGYIAYHGYARYKLALYYFRKSLDGAIEDNNNKRVIFALRMILLSNFMLNNFEGLESDVDKLYKTAEKENDKIAMSLAIYAIGRIQYTQGNKNKAFEYFDNAIDMLKDENNDGAYQMLLSYYGEIGTFLLDAKDYDKALTYYLNSEKYVDKIEGKLYPHYVNLQRLVICSRLAEIFYILGQKEKAEEYYNSAIRLDRAKSIELQWNLLPYLYKSEKYDEVIDLANTTISYYNAQSDSISEGVRVTYTYLQNTYEKKREYEKANIYANKLITLLINTSAKKSESEAVEYATIHEVNKYIAEKERNRLYYLFALGTCVFLFLVLIIWIYYNRKIAKKNKFMARHIKELLKQQEINDTLILDKTSFIVNMVNEKDNASDNFCPDTRKDQLCIDIRDILLKEKAYQNPSLSRDIMIERLGTNKELFIDAFQYCFKTSFSEYINYLRLKDSIILLEQSDLTIEDISERVGFGTIRTFQRQFQTKYNMSPKAYRNSIVKEPMDTSVVNN